MSKNHSWLIITLALFFLPLVWPQPTLAQSPTPKLTVAPTPTTSTEDIKNRVQERIEQITEDFQKRAFWGNLKEVTNSTLVLDTTKGEKRIKTDSTTKFFGQNQKAINFADLEIGNFIIAMGLWKENGTLNGKRIIALPQAPKPVTPRYAIFGKVADVSAEEKILSIASVSQGETTSQIAITSKTILTASLDDKEKKIDFASIKTGDQIVAIGTKNADGNTLTAKIARILPGNSPQEELTPTPTPTKTSKP